MAGLSPRYIHEWNKPAGGIDQFNVLTNGPGKKIRKMVHTLFEKVGYDRGFIYACSEHFFDTPADHLKIMAEAAKECLY